MAQTKNMTEGRPLGLLLRFAAPMMAGNIFQLLYNIADSAVVGNLLGVKAFAAVAGSGFYYWFAVFVALGFTQGFGTLLAQRFGADDFQGFRKALAMSAVLSVVLGLVLSLAYTLSVRPVLILLNTPADIIDDTALYLQIVLAALVVTFINNMLGSVLRAVGNSKTPLYAMIVSGIINVVLDIALVLYTPLGVAAVAIATVIAQVIACVICVIALPGGELRPSRGDWAFDTYKTKALLALGGPMALRNFVIMGGALPVQYVINGYGALFVAGIAAPRKLYDFIGIIGNGMEGAAATFVAQNYGAGKYGRINSGVRTAASVMLAGAAVISVLLFIFGQWILGLFLAGEEAAGAMVYAIGLLRLMVAGVPLLYMLCLYRSAIQGMGNSIIPMISGFAELFLCVAAVYVLPPYIGVYGVYISEVIGWPVCAVMMYIAYRIIYSEKTKNAEA